MSICLIPKNLVQLGETLARMTADSIVLAGGTDLVIRMRETLPDPDVLLSLSDVEELQTIQVTPERAVIGAMATMTRIEEALNGLDDLQALADAAGGVGSLQIRNKATIGGNVANASPAGDLPPVLWLLDAQVELMGPGGALRSLPIRQFMTGVQQTALARNEVVTGFTIDRNPLRGWRSAFEKLGHRSQVTISRIGLAMALLQDGEGVIQDARVVAGAIKTVPFQLEAAEALLRGQKPSPELAVAIGDTFQGNTRRVYKAAAAKGVAETVLERFCAWDAAEKSE